MLNDECRTNDEAAGTAPAFCMEVSSSFRVPHSPFSPPSRGTPSRRRRGFTLLELVLVMVIIAVVLAMVAPSLSGFSAARDADYTASQVISVSRWAREQAISEGRVYRLNFNPSTQEYFVTAQVGGTFQRPPVEFGQVFTVPEGVVMAWEAPTDGGVAVIDFFPSGRSQPARIEVVARNGQVTSIASRSATEPLKVLTPEEAVAG